jgi:predicted Zn-dependent protease
MKTGIIGSIIGLTALLGGILYLNNEASLIQWRHTPCSEPLTFRTGDIDERFGINEADLKQLMAEVSELWAGATGNSVIIYAENGSISVNLIYAEQQLLTDSERQFRDRLRAEEQSISVAEREYLRMNQRFKEMESEYRQDSNRLQNEIQELNSWVNRMNDEGGFNEREVEIFESRKQDIDQKTAALNRRALLLQQEAERLNSTIDQLNHKINQKNILINEYNNTFTGTNRFTQGSYENIGNVKRINIYQFSHRDELRLVLAHEVGHALGINHVDNPKSIMYNLMGSQNMSDLSLTAEDIDALKKICGP